MEWRYETDGSKLCVRLYSIGNVFAEFRVTEYMGCLVISEGDPVVVYTKYIPMTEFRMAVESAPGLKDEHRKNLCGMVQHHLEQSKEEADESGLGKVELYCSDIIR